MITELMLVLIALGAGIVFVAWSNTRKRKQDAEERREVAESTGKLKQELERTANEIVGRMENHVAHLENILDESERNRTQLEGRVAELKKLLKKSEGQSGEIRDLLARLEDAGTEINSMQRKMDTVERKLNLALTTPLPVQQPVAIPQMTQPLVTPIMQQPVAPISKPTVTQVTPPAVPMNPMGPITVPPIIRPPTPAPKPEPPKVEPPKVAPPKVEPPQEQPATFDKILEESIAEPPKVEAALVRSSIILSPENKQPMKVVEADPVKIEATRKKLTEVSAKLAESPAQEQGGERPKKSSRRKRDVRKAAVEAIKAAEESNLTDAKLPEEPRPKPAPEKSFLPERRDLKLETTDSSIIKEMLLSGMSIEDISRETGLGRGAIELVQEMTRRQLDRR